MNLRPKTSHEKLLWERRANLVLSEELRQTQIELGTLQSEFDEFKHDLSVSDDIKEKYKWLMFIHGEAKKHKRELDLKLKEKNKEEQRLIIEMAKLNLKLKSYEEQESMDRVSTSVEEK